MYTAYGAIYSESYNSQKFIHKKYLYTMKVLVATDKPFAKVAVNGIREIVESAGFQLAILEKYKTPQELIDAIADADAVIIRSDLITKEVVDAAKNLKIVVRAGAGYDNIDLAACTAKNVVAMNTPGQNANAVAELVFGMAVLHNRHGFDGTSGSELKNKKIGIHAYGNVGKLVGQIAKGFGMKVFAFDPFLDKATIEKDGVTAITSVEELYKECQYVSLTAQTKNSIGEKLLLSMPEGATLINTARCEVINEAELLKVMETRKDFSYLSDIAPACKAQFEANYKGRYFFTPKKLGAQTEEANINAGLAAARQIVGFLKTGERKFQLNK